MGVSLFFELQRQTNLLISTLQDIPSQFRYSYAHLWLAIIENDEEKMRQYAYEVGGITDTQVLNFVDSLGMVSY